MRNQQPNEPLLNKNLVDVENVLLPSNLFLGFTKKLECPVHFLSLKTLLKDNPNIKKKKQ
jgi:hypothetical protein